MKIKVSNLGVIGEGTIDLSKKISLFCGQNGTGKTYLAYIIYRLLTRNLRISDNTEIADHLISNRSININIDFQSIFDFKQSKLEETKKSLPEIFGIGINESEKLFSEFRIEDTETKEDFKSKIISSKIDSRVNIFGLDLSLTKNKDDDQLTLSIINENISEETINISRLFIKSYIETFLALYPITKVVMFPVERNYINTFSKQLSIRKQNTLDYLKLTIDKEKNIGKIKSLLDFKRYPLAISDELKIADDLVEIKKKKSKFFDFAEELERELLLGKVDISNDGEIEFTPKISPSTKLPIQMTASIIKTLSSLIVYLKHRANENDLIIIDEPEINLHPENQIILTRIFARLANKGFRLLISTHSDYIVRELNNLLILSRKDKPSVMKNAKEFDYKADEYINQEDLGVYSFKFKNSNDSKITIEQVPVTETGFNIDAMDSVIDKQNDISERLYYSVKYDE
jgi:energy-coupling factor transporter ATP-binding protein EcfA2